MGWLFGGKKKEMQKTQEKAIDGWCRTMGYYCASAGGWCSEYKGWCPEERNETAESKERTGEDTLLVEVKLSGKEWAGVSEAVVQHEERKRSAEETMRRVDRMEGREFEAWCAGVLRKLGFQNVYMTATTGDQGVDITAEKDGTKYAIQCKRYSSDLGNHPVQEVYAGKAMYGCKVGAVMTNQYFTPGARDLAKATGTKLWDRGRLITMLQQIAKEQDEQAAG